MVYLLVLLGLISNSCSNKKESFQNDSFDNNYTKAKIVLQKNCFSCHKDYQNYSKNDWVRKGLIIPKEPNNSPLFKSLISSAKGSKSKMPPGEALKREEVDVIKNWIETTGFSKTQMDSGISLNGRLNNLEAYKKCYTLLTQSPLPVLSKEEIQEINLIGATKSCQAILSKSIEDFNSKSLNKDSLEIVSNMHKLHFSWFPSLHLYNLMDTWSTYDLYDIDQEALYFTRILFDLSKNVDSLFEGNKILKSLRLNSQKQNEILFQTPSADEHHNVKIIDKEFIQGVEKGQHKSWSPPTVSRGSLYGIKELISSDFKGLDYYVTSTLRPSLFKASVPLVMNNGGGALGASTHLLFNIGRNPGEKMDGGKKLPRRWSKALVKDFLCRDIPVIRISDGEKYISSNSKISFNKGSSCQTCHATMDNLAALHRNKELVLSTDKADFQSLHILSHQSSSNKKESLSDGSPTFYKALPTGKFVYRDIFGKLYERPLKNFDDLGLIFKNLPDLHYCISKRYFKYFTGLNFNIEEDNDLKNPNPLIKEFNQITKRFQVHKRTDLLLFDIFDSNIFWSRSFLAK